jgi:hypothetical protein
MSICKVEHEAIVTKREKAGSSITWDEFKSMTFTLQVCSINSLNILINSFIFDN